MPLLITIWLAKLALKLSRLLGRGGGSALPGLIAERLDPRIIGKLGRFSEGAILVTGTNGKTTTAKKLAAVLSAGGKTVMTNPSGSNLSRGVASSLIEHCGWSGRPRHAVAVFEVDEASMPAVAGALQPKLIIVLNLFRDQLDRYGELDKTAAMIGRSIAACEAALLLNADDPLVAHLDQYAGQREVRFFGVDAKGLERLPHDLAADSDHCPLCGRALLYTRNFFGHLGHYRCSEGHFQRPQPLARLTHYKGQGMSGSQLRLAVGTERLALNLPLPGLYNTYNALAALQAADYLGITLTVAQKALEAVEAAFGRVESLLIDGRLVYLLLIKNPTGFNQVIQTFLLDQVKLPLMIAINDNFADGRDVSWLWDVAFEELQDKEHSIVVSGIRANDLALRLQYADVAITQTETELAAALRELLKSTAPDQPVYILPTYTAMLELRQGLSQQANLKGFWE